MLITSLIWTCDGPKNTSFALHQDISYIKHVGVHKVKIEEHSAAVQYSTATFAEVKTMFVYRLQH